MDVKELTEKLRPLGIDLITDVIHSFSDTPRFFKDRVAVYIVFVSPKNLQNKNWPDGQFQVWCISEQGVSDVWLYNLHTSEEAVKMVVDELNNKLSAVGCLKQTLTNIAHQNHSPLWMSLHSVG